MGMERAWLPPHAESEGLADEHGDEKDYERATVGYASEIGPSRGTHSLDSIIVFARCNSQSSPKIAVCA